MLSGLNQIGLIIFFYILLYLAAMYTAMSFIGGIDTLIVDTGLEDLMKPMVVELLG